MENLSRPINLLDAWQQIFSARANPLYALEEGKFVGQTTYWTKID